MAKPKLLNQDELQYHINVVRLGEQPNSSKSAKAKAVESKRIIAETYIPLAKNMADKFTYKLGKDDAQSAAYLGMMLGIRSWNPNKGALPSWLRLYIKNALIREVDKKNLIRLPLELAPKKAMIHHLKEQGINETDIATKLKLPVEKLNKIETTPSVSVWLDALPLEEVMTSQDNNIGLINDLLSQLTELERIVIEARFGIGHDGLCHTYEEVANLIDTDTETVQSIEAKAIATLKLIS
jgi:RNA polymerase sigma factor (sigma-70 family)